MQNAQNRQAISAKMTESGSEPPAQAAPAGIDAAIPARRARNCRAALTSPPTATTRPSPAQTGLRA